jgi:hypothetical protein
MTALFQTTAVPLVGADIAILRVLWSSVAATLVVAISFSAAILFIVRCSEMRTIHRRGAAAAYGALSVVALCSFGGAVVYGLVLLTQKS